MHVYRYGHDTIQHRARASLTIGTFDGVHLGHHHLLSAVLAGECPTVVTFDPHPRHVLSSGPDRLQILTPLPEKLRKLEALGIERTVVLPFNREMASIEAERFLADILVNGIGMDRLVVGFNHSFGRNREGNINFMRDRQERYGYTLQVVEAHEADELAVSSTRIRVALETGKLADANRYLGQRYRTQARVIRGEGRGRDLGYPTANLAFLDPDQLLPAEGVYAVRMRDEDGSWYDGVASIGRKETFGDDIGVTLEVHVFDQSLDLYDHTIWVEWVAFLRGQEKFDSAQALIDQMDDDSREARRILGALAANNHNTHRTT